MGVKRRRRRRRRRRWWSWPEGESEEGTGSEGQLFPSSSAATGSFRRPEPHFAIPFLRHCNSSVVAALLRYCCKALLTLGGEKGVFERKWRKTK